MADGLNIAEVKEQFARQAEARKRSISDSQMRKILRDELLQTGRLTDDDGPTFPIKRI